MKTLGSIYSQDYQVISVMYYVHFIFANNNTLFTLVIYFGYVLADTGNMGIHFGDNHLNIYFCFDFVTKPIFVILC